MSRRCGHVRGVGAACEETEGTCRNLAGSPVAPGSLRMACSRAGVFSARLVSCEEWRRREGREGCLGALMGFSWRVFT